MTIKLQKTKYNQILLEKNFSEIERYFNNSPFSSFEGKLFQITIDRILYQQKIANPLNFIPTDVIVTSSSEQAYLTFHVKLFTEKYLILSSSGPCTIRVLIGKFNITPLEVGT